MTEIEKKIREEFPLLQQDPVVYLDNGATTQKPKSVLDAMLRYYETENANPLRGMYDLSVAATEAYENARKKVADFIHAKSEREIVFTRNASEAFNLVAYSYARTTLKPGDEIIVSIAEHHSNFLPWQKAAEATGAKVCYFYCEEDGSFDLEKLKAMLNEHTKLVAMTQVSNLFGRVNDIQTAAALAHEVGAVFVADGAQSVPHMPVNVQELDVDFFAFSGHKMYAPMGIGVLYGKEKLLEAMPPFLYGGEMIETVTIEKTTYAELPHKFEAGTVNAGGAVGLAAAIDFVNRYGFDTIVERENALTEYAFRGLTQIPHVKIIGAKEAENHHGILTFQLEGVHPHDVAAIFSDENIAVRAGHHCAQPLHKHLGVMSTTRCSLAFYNTFEEVDRFLDVLKTMRQRMGYV